MKNRCSPSNVGTVVSVRGSVVDIPFGLLPHRPDCVAALVPGILIYESDAEGEVYVAVDEGVSGTLIDGPRGGAESVRNSESVGLLAVRKKSFATQD